MDRATDNGAASFRLERFFDRPVDACGLFIDRFGQLRRQFQIAITSAREGDILVLHERFTYDDGEAEERTWRIKVLGQGRYQGSADNSVIGTASGVVTGNAFHWRYPFLLRAGRHTLRVTFDDWMYLQPGGTVLNRARVLKFGLLIGEISGAFVRRAGTAPASREHAALEQAAE